MITRIPLADRVLARITRQQRRGPGRKAVGPMTTLDVLRTLPHLRPRLVRAAIHRLASEGRIEAQPGRTLAWVAR